MFRKSLFIAAHEMGNHVYYIQSKSLCDDQWKSYEELKEKQDADLRHMIYMHMKMYHIIIFTQK